LNEGWYCLLTARDIGTGVAPVCRKLRQKSRAMLPYLQTEQRTGHNMDTWKRAHFPAPDPEVWRRRRVFYGLPPTHG
jgi:hypothetical protein